MGCSSKNNGNTDASTQNDAITGFCSAGIDPSVDMSTAITLAEGDEATGYICPTRDKDYYRLEIPSDKRLLRINLQHSAPVTQVGLSYTILKENQTVVGSSPSGQNNQFNALHCLEPGVYYLQVQDEGNDSEDAKNAYRLSYSTEADPDSAEPTNNDYANAVMLDQERQGYISCTGDEDYYKITVENDQLLELTLTTTQATPVDIRYTVMRVDGETLEAIASDGVENGSDGAATLSSIATVQGAGTYIIKVDDDGNNDSDVATPYAITASTRAEPDDNDKGTRNDHPNGDIGAATTLGEYTGSCLSFSSTGRIASIGDVDYFRIGGPALSGAPPAIEVSVQFNGNTVVDPSLGLVYISDTTCTKDRCCRVLNRPSDGVCSNVLDCVDSSFICQAKSEDYCGDVECAGENPGLYCGSENKCAGNSTCIRPANQCGATQFFRNGTDGGTVSTAQPLLHGGPWYIRVSDVAGDEYDYDATYTLQGRVCPDPDAIAGEGSDSGYFPRLIAQTDDVPLVNAEGMDRGALEDFFDDTENPRASGITIPVAALVETPAGSGTFVRPDAPWGWSGYINGFIAYEHDTDHYTIPNPCAAIPDDEMTEAGACILQAEFGKTGSNCPPNLEFNFVLSKGDGGDDFHTGGDAVSATSSPFGYSTADPDCRILVRSRASDTFTLNVSDIYHNASSLDCGYRVRFQVAHFGCSDVTTPTGPCQSNEYSTCFFR